VPSHFEITYEKNYKQAVLPVGAPERTPDRSQTVPSVAEETSRERPLGGSTNIACYKANAVRERTPRGRRQLARDFSLPSAEGGD
jgi:hypothetical protein